jgi:hypothetical protein
MGLSHELFRGKRFDSGFVCGGAGIVKIYEWRQDVLNGDRTFFTAPISASSARNQIDRSRVTQFK